MLPTEVIVDVFEMGNIQRIEGRPNVHFYSTIDLEMPSYFATENILLVTDPIAEGCVSITSNTKLFACG